jgi:hypothetical protein
MAKIVKSVIFGIVFLFFIQCVHGEDISSLKKEIEALKQRIIYLEEKVRQYGEREEEAKEISEKIEKVADILEDIDIGAGATYVLQGTHNANADTLSRNGEDVLDGSYSVDLEFEKGFGDYGKGFIHLETGDGAGVEDELKVFSNVNRDADDSDNSVSLTEAWYEYYFKILPLVFTFGKIDPTLYIDNNEYANDECAQFLGRIFRNSPTIEFPDNSGGTRIGLKFADFIEVDFIMLDADSDWEDFFDDIFVAAQFNVKPFFFEREGNYRLIAWFNDREHTKWNDSGKTKEDSWGIGVSFDQELTDNLGVFLRYGWQDPKVYLNGEDFSLEQAWSLGVQLSGALWTRVDDIFAIAFGQVIPSDDYKKVNNLRAKSEKHLEAYYSLKVNEHLTLSPDIHLIWNPYGDDATNGDKMIVVGGIRTQVDF